jgi:prolyl-tRNA editing enzyme YbaK/EbsC (Cys-tRNA(Pro) deacylase)
MKSLLFRTEESKQAILILASGANQVNESLIARLVGEKVVKAEADFVRKTTGFAIGGIPPLGHQQEIKYIFVDEDLLSFDTLWAAAGTPHTVFSLRSQDIQILTEGKIVAIK